MRERTSRLIIDIQRHLAQSDTWLDIREPSGVVDGDPGEVGRADHEGTVGFAET